MDKDTANTDITNFNINFINTDNTGASFTEGMSNISNALDTMFQTTIPSKTNVDITTPAGSLNIPITNNMANSIAVSVTAYWSNTVEVTGAPVSCDNIDSVSNTASSIESIIESGLLSLANNVLRVDYYMDFISVITDAVNTIVWTVNESSSQCSETHSVTVT